MPAVLRQHPLLRFSLYWLSGLAISSLVRSLVAPIFSPHSQSHPSVAPTAPHQAATTAPGSRSHESSESGAPTRAQGNIFKRSWIMLKETYNEWSDDQASMQAAALAYYTIFSIAPLFLIAIAIAGFFFGREAAQGALFGQVAGLVGRDSAAALQQMVAHAQRPSTNIVMTVVGVIVLIFGAGGRFRPSQADAQHRLGYRPQTRPWHLGRAQG